MNVAARHLDLWFLDVFGRWEEVGGPVENSCRHVEKILYSILLLVQQIVAVQLATIRHLFVFPSSCIGLPPSYKEANWETGIIPGTNVG